MADTADGAEDMFGDKLYQIRARRALPLLVRQALSRKPIFYEALADELDMPNPRNLNYVLGSVGTTLNELSRKRDRDKIPQIQSLVINQQHRLPGEGFDGFLASTIKNFSSFSLEQKRAYLDSYWQNIYAYPYWHEVLEACGLAATTMDAAEAIEKAKRGRTGGGGEGPEHRKLKEFIANNPQAAGLPNNFAKTQTEAPLPSGDKLDILFDSPSRKVAVEIKSKNSNDTDLVRGLFQCVKYRAVMEAERGAKSATYRVETMLVVGTQMPKALAPLRNSLGVNVIEVTDT